MYSRTVISIEDTYIASNKPKTNFSSSQSLLIGASDNPTNTYTSFIVFDTPRIPPGEPLTAAYLRLYNDKKSKDDISPINVFRVTSNFAPNLVTYKTRPTSVDTNIVFELAKDSLNTYVDIDITELVRGWIDGDYPNYGLELRGPTSDLIGFRSINYPDDNHFLKLIINYMPARAIGSTRPSGNTHSKAQIGAACNTDPIDETRANCEPILNHIYVSNYYDNTVSVIDGATNSVSTTIPVDTAPREVAVNPSTNRIYVANSGQNNVSVIDGSTNTVTATIPVGDIPFGVDVNTANNRIYVSNSDIETISIIDGTTNTVINTINVGDQPRGVAVNPNTNSIYVANATFNTVSVIDGLTDTVIATIDVGIGPFGLAVNPETDRIYVTNFYENTLSVIDGSTNTVIATVNTGDGPIGVVINQLTNIIYVANSSANTISEINGGTNTVISTITVGNTPVLAAFNPDTNLLYVTNFSSDDVSVIDVTTNSVITTIAVGDAPYGVVVR